MKKYEKSTPTIKEDTFYIPELNKFLTRTELEAYEVSKLEDTPKKENK